MQKDLLVNAKMPTRRNYVRRLTAQQKALVSPARGGRKEHRKNIQNQYENSKKRMKLYESRVSHRKALIEKTNSRLNTLLR